MSFNVMTMSNALIGSKYLYPKAVLNLWEDNNRQLSDWHQFMGHNLGSIGLSINGEWVKQLFKKHTNKT